MHKRTSDLSRFLPRFKCIKKRTKGNIFPLSEYVLAYPYAIVNIYLIRNKSRQKVLNNILIII